MPRIFTAYSGDISGRYIEFFSLYGQMGYPVPELAGIVERVVSAQKPLGYFGEEGFETQRLTQRETKIFWGNGRLLIGLMEYHRLTNDPKVLSAACRLGDFLFQCGLHESTSSIGQGVAADVGPAGFATTFCSCLEGIVRLFEVTRDPRYATLAKGVADLLPETFEGFHSHGRMTALRGMVDLAGITHDAAMMDRIIRQWKVIEAEHVTPLGGIREHFGDGCTRDEGCSVADWVMLSLKLFSATGEAEYLEAAEHGFLNHLLAVQFENGGFGHQVLLPQKVKDHEPLLMGIGLPKGECLNYTNEAYWCCSFHGPLAILNLARHLAAVPTDTGLKINLPLTAEIASAGLELETEADIFGQTLEITIRRAPSTPVTLQVQIPAWAHTPEASLRLPTGQPEPVTPEGNMLTLHRLWQPGEKLLMNFHPTWHVEPAFPLAQLSYAPEKEAVFFGPLLLGYECSDDLLWGQLMTGPEIVTTLVVIEDHPRSLVASERLPMIVEYFDTEAGRTIWAPRVLTPTLLRYRDQPMRTVHTVARRAFASLPAAQQEELTSYAQTPQSGAKVKTTID
jgi:DUF1680 family protein